MSFIGFNLSNISDAYVGNTQVQQIYFGSNLVWERVGPETNEYFYIETLEANTDITWNRVNNSDAPNNLQYSVDKINWTTIATRNTFTIQDANTKVYCKCIPDYYSHSVGCFDVNKDYNVGGNIMSMCFGDNYANQTSLSGITSAGGAGYYGTLSAMFQNQTHLISAGHLSLPATTLSLYCYTDMFYGCTSLTAAPELPATTLTTYCYFNMFVSCTSLTTAPELPATTLALGCYNEMFKNCTSLTTAPELPATTLARECYWDMFYGCTSLNYIKCLATNISATDCTKYWVYNVASSGTFVRDTNMTSWPTGTSGIPSGWSIVPPYSENYLTFEAIQPTTFTFSTNDLQYSLDNSSTWTTLTAGSSTQTINPGNKILWKQTGLTPDSTNGIGTFSATGNFKAYGNIMSLYYGDNFIGQTDLTGKDYAFYQLFYQNTKLTDATNLILPATTLSPYCYSNMFRGCTSLVVAPQLPATTLAESCYRSMFNSCTSLTTAPELPATTLQRYCYYFMFENCTSLTTAPDLPALGHVGYAYNGMFKSCTSLNYIKCMLSPAGTSSNWVQNVASTGTFVKNSNTTNWTTGNNGIPSGWTVQNAS